MYHCLTKIIKLLETPQIDPIYCARSYSQSTFDLDRKESQENLTESFYNMQVNPDSLGFLAGNETCLSSSSSQIGWSSDLQKNTIDSDLISNSEYVRQIWSPIVPSPRVFNPEPRLPSIYNLKNIEANINSTAANFPATTFNDSKELKSTFKVLIKTDSGAC
jgi:hypothetical protein